MIISIIIFGNHRVFAEGRRPHEVEQRLTAATEPVRREEERREEERRGEKRREEERRKDRTKEKGR